MHNYLNEHTILKPKQLVDILENKTSDRGYKIDGNGSLVIYKKLDKEGITWSDFQNTYSYSDYIVAGISLVLIILLLFSRFKEIIWINKWVLGISFSFATSVAISLFLIFLQSLDSLEIFNTTYQKYPEFFNYGVYTIIIYLLCSIINGFILYFIQKIRLNNKNTLKFNIHLYIIIGLFFSLVYRLFHQNESLFMTGYPCTFG